MVHLGVSWNSSCDFFPELQCKTILSPPEMQNEGSDLPWWLFNNLRAALWAWKHLLFYWDKKFLFSPKPETHLHAGSAAFCKTHTWFLTFFYVVVNFIPMDSRSNCCVCTIKTAFLKATLYFGSCLVAIIYTFLLVSLWRSQPRVLVVYPFPAPTFSNMYSVCYGQRKSNGAVSKALSVYVSYSP